MNDTDQICPYPFGEPNRLALQADYDRIRKTPGLTQVQLSYGKPAWLATRYEDVHRVLTDTRFSRKLAVENDEPRTYFEQRDFGMLNMDPPRHTRIRQIVASAYTPRRTEQLRPHAIDIADELIDKMLAGPQPADLVEGYAQPLPVTVICQMFGLPVEERGRFAELAEAITSTDRLSPEQVTSYIQQLWGNLTELISQRRRDPQDDALSALVQASEKDELSEHEVVQIAMGQLAASYETTASVLASSLYALLVNTDQQDLLWMNPTLLDQAIEELLRYCPMSSATYFARYATEDVTIGGTPVKAGEYVLASLIAANKDSSMFQDPDVLNLTAAKRKQHMAFGSGIHRCLGTGIARMVLQVGVGSIIRRVPGLQLAVPESELVWKSHQLMRGLKSLPVTL